MSEERGAAEQIALLEQQLRNLRNESISVTLTTDSDEESIIIPDEYSSAIQITNQAESPISYYLSKSTLNVHFRDKPDAALPKKQKTLTKYDLDRDRNGCLTWPSCNSHVIVGYPADEIADWLRMSTILANCHLKPGTIVNCKVAVTKLALFSLAMLKYEEEELLLPGMFFARITDEIAIAFCSALELRKHFATSTLQSRMNRLCSVFHRANDQLLI